MSERVVFMGNNDGGLSSIGIVRMLIGWWVLGVLLLEMERMRELDNEGVF